MSSRRPLSVRARPFALVAALWNLILLMKLVAELQLDELLEVRAREGLGTHLLLDLGFLFRAQGCLNSHTHTHRHA